MMVLKSVHLGFITPLLGSQPGGQGTTLLYASQMKTLGCLAPFGVRVCSSLPPLVSSSRFPLVYKKGFGMILGTVAMYLMYSGSPP